MQVWTGSNKIGNDLKIDYRVGAILQDNKWAQLYNSANGLNVTNVFSLNFATTRAYSEDASHVQTQAVYGQVNLAWKEALFLDLSLREDWASTLPKPYHYNYPSVGLSGIISDLFTLPEAISFFEIKRKLCSSW
jgi:outer membrane receptor protein involved in Fe transport